MDYEKVQKPSSSFVPVQKKLSGFAPPVTRVQAKEVTAGEQEQMPLGTTPATDANWLMKHPLFKGNQFLQRVVALQSESESLESEEETLQRQEAGNESATPHSITVQAKLTIGDPGDKYEQEADRVASQVVKQINSPDAASSSQGQSVQRMEEPVEELQRQPSISDLQRTPLPLEVQREAMPAEEELQAKSILQRREADAGGEATNDLDTAINSARGGGQPLDAGLQRSMGQAMGADFSGVKVHTDAQSDQLNQSIQAKAFTTGQDVFFRQGAYDPGSRGGQELIAHELTHVVQQNGGAVQRSPSLPLTPMIQAKLNPSPEPGRELECEYFDDFLGAAVKILEVVHPRKLDPEKGWIGGSYIIEEKATGATWRYNAQTETYSPFSFGSSKEGWDDAQTTAVINQYQELLTQKGREVENLIMAELRNISTLEEEKALNAGKKALNKILNSTIKVTKKTSNHLARQATGRELNETLLKTVEEKVKEAIEDVIYKTVISYIADKKRQFLQPDGKLKNGDQAVVPLDKLTGYCLKADHPVGKFKAKQFKDLLGITSENYQVLEAALKQAAITESAEIGSFDKYGQRVTIYFNLRGVGEKASNQCRILSGWIYAPEENSNPQLTSCYIDPGKDIGYKAFFSDDTLVAEDDWPDHLEDPLQAYKAGNTEERVERRITKKTNRLYQERYYDKRGYPVKDIDYTSPTNKEGKPHLGAEGGEHLPPPHQHEWSGDHEKGFIRGEAKPL